MDAPLDAYGVARRRSPCRRALVTSAVGAFALATLGAGAARTTVVTEAPLVPHAAASTPAPCPRHMLPDDDVCVHLPNDDDPTAAESATNAHRERDGRWTVYDQIPRRPDRPEDYRAYVYPFRCDGCVVDGYDLDRPDDLQRRSPDFRFTGHGAIDLEAPRGTPIALVSLDRQQGPAELVYAGPLIGTSVVTLHTLREAGGVREYIVIFGHLESAAPGLLGSPASSAPLRDGSLIGWVGDSGSPGRVHLHLEVRRVRPGVDVRKLKPSALVDAASTIVCDPRNVLSLK